VPWGRTLGLREGTALSVQQVARGKTGGEMLTFRQVRTLRGAVSGSAHASGDRMKTCAVLQCPNPGSALVMSGQDPAAGGHELYVCTEHKAAMEAGAPWDLEGGSVVTGPDMAPLVKGWRARPSAGAEGFTLSLEVAGQAQEIQVFLRPAEARTLAAFITAANDDG
jgi:hypothetical protein